MSWLCECTEKMDCISTRTRTNGVIRRYSCEKCGHRYSTFEMLQIRPGNYARKSVDIRKWHEQLLKRVDEFSKDLALLTIPNPEINEEEND